MTTRSGSPFTSYVVPGLGGGLNKAASSFKLNDDELRETTNTRTLFAGSIGVRAGLRQYEVTADYMSGTSSAAVKAHRYSRTDGDVSLLVSFMDGSVYADSNNGIFSSAGSVSYSADSMTRFLQWRDTVLAFGTSGVPRAYNTDTASSFQAVSMAGASIYSVGSYLTGAEDAAGTEGAWTDGNTYSYRFSFDYYMGDNFIGESYPLHGNILIGSYNEAVLGVLKYGDLYWKLDYTPTVATYHFQIKRGALIVFPTLAKTINIYRSVGAPTGSALDAAQQNAGVFESDFFYVGSIEIADYLTAAEGDVLFTDYGFAGDGSIRLATQETFEALPKARFAALYKGMCWYGNISDTLNTFGALTGGQWTTVTQESITNSARIYYSNYYEPCSVRFKSWLEIQPGDGEEITGLMAWKDRALFVFKPNSITGIYGGDSEIAPGVLDIEVEVVDENVGCIAPETLAFGEGGIMFLSNRGVMYFDGTTPIPIKSKFVDYYIDKIPANRRARAAGVYDNKNRRYMLAISQDT